MIDGLGAWRKRGQKQNAAAGGKLASEKIQFVRFARRVQGEKFVRQQNEQHWQNRICGLCSDAMEAKSCFLLLANNRGEQQKVTLYFSEQNQPHNPPGG